MKMDDAVQIVKPVPDSHFRLRPCKCSSDNVAYVKYLDGPEEVWAVQCFDCGYRAMRAPGYKIQHDAQAAWNNGVGQ